MVDLLSVVLRGIESCDADIKPYSVLSQYMLVSLHMQIQVLLISYYGNAITDLVWYHDQSVLLIACNLVQVNLLTRCTL